MTLVTNNIDLNVAVFTTQNVVHQKFPIVRVYLDDEGNWQFFDAVSTNAGENAMLVSLNSILNIDPSIEEILNMQPNHCATIQDKGKGWTITPYTSDEE
ncbi:MAG: hypothetical protein ACHQII_06170 [Bacteroidia bacterium]